ncbi:MAG: DUF1109 family protein [Hyphomicrobiales bacterium]|nr:DUF1109 family protein [Hyphomicrobiales bacterium]MDE2017727.1 DUF1109 family protein [Hyphomicrobiales bacterium]
MDADDLSADGLVRRLAADLRPAPARLAPGRRLAIWVAVALVAGAAVIALEGPRPDLAARLAQPRFLAEQLAAVAAALGATYAAFCAGRPDEPAWRLWAALAPSALWLALLGAPCIDIAFRLGRSGLEFSGDVACLPAIAVAGAAPAAFAWAEVARSSEFRPRFVAFAATLGAAAWGAVVLRAFHAKDAALMVLVWQAGSVALLAALGAAAGALAARARKFVAHA